MDIVPCITVSAYLEIDAETDTRVKRSRDIYQDDHTRIKHVLMRIQVGCTLPHRKNTRWESPTRQKSRRLSMTHISYAYGYYRQNCMQNNAY